MPSTTSSWVSRPFASSTVMTPSLPTLLIASAMISPMVASLFAEIVPTCAISFCSLVGLESALSSLTMAPTALSMPRLRVIGSCPAATILSPSVKIARASTVAVVVPSPATSEVLEATSFTIWAPMFSNLSSSSISFATVTPSLVTLGGPKDFSRTTLRPRGPSVTVTASARTFTPRRILSRASWLNFTSLAAMAFSSSALDHAEDVFLAHDQMFFAVELDLGAGVLAEQHGVAGLDVERDHLPVLADLSLPDGDDLPLLRLLLGGIGDDDAALGLLNLLLEALHDYPILKWPDLHAHGSFRERKPVSDGKSGATVIMPPPLSSGGGRVSGRVCGAPPRSNGGGGWSPPRRPGRPASASRHARAGRAAPRAENPPTGRRLPRR